MNSSVVASFPGPTTVSSLRLLVSSLTVNDQASNLKLETVVGPGKLATTEEFIKDVQVRYVAQKK